jgi:hypothetical protein
LPHAPLRGAWPATIDACVPADTRDPFALLAGVDATTEVLWRQARAGLVELVRINLGLDREQASKT